MVTQWINDARVSIVDTLKNGLEQSAIYSTLQKWNFQINEIERNFEFSVGTIAHWINAENICQFWT